MPRRLIIANLCLLVSLATLSVGGGVLTSEMGPRQRTLDHPVNSWNAAPLPHAHHSSRATANNDVTHYSPHLQTLEVLSSSVLLQPLVLLVTPRMEKDLLSLTQRRRE